MLASNMNSSISLGKKRKSMGTRKEEELTCCSPFAGRHGSH